MNKDKCPACSAEWEYVKDGKVYSRCIGIERRGVYDGVTEWKCPDCNTRFDRWDGRMLGESEISKGPYR